jgi:uncharacterized protein YxeA
MESRLVIAYALLLLLAAGLAVLIFYRVYYGRERTYVRRLRREARAREDAAPEGGEAGRPE